MQIHDFFIPVVLTLLCEQGFDDPWLFFKARSGS
jgi:hypothetical protein